MTQKLTPAMQQYYDIKKEYHDCVIFFRMGDFYEMFGEDAHIAHKILGINVTSRNKNAPNPEPMAGVPFHAKDKYLPALVKAGYKVAIVEQVGEVGGKGIIQREVVRVVTPATLSLEGDQFEDGDDNIIISITFEKGIYGFSLLNLNNNSWKTSEFHDIKILKGELFKLSPKEIILQKTLFSHEELKETLEKKYGLSLYYYDFSGDPYKKLLSQFGIHNLKGFGIEELGQGIFASALLLGYLETNQKSTLGQLKSICKYDTKNFLEMDEGTMRNLDLVFNIATKSQNIGTLFGVLNKQKTPMGRRMLRENILFPPLSIQEIEKRQKLIKILKSESILLAKIREKLSFIGDIDALLNRLSLGRITPRDLLNLKKSLESIVEIEEILLESKKKTLRDFLL